MPYVVMRISFPDSLICSHSHLSFTILSYLEMSRSIRVILRSYKHPNSNDKTRVGPGVVRVPVVTYISSTGSHVAGEVLISCCTRFRIFTVTLMRIRIFWEVTLSR